MTNHEAVLAELEACGVTYFTGVPDSYLHGFCSALRERGDWSRNIICANEGNAIAVAVGHYLATGETPLVYMQNSGEGNAINPLASLACEDMLAIPMVLLIGWRGDPYHGDHIQHKLQGDITPLLLDDLHIPHLTLLGDLEDLRETTRAAINLVHERHAPVALLVPKGTLNGSKTFGVEEGLLPSRWEAIDAVVDTMPNETIFCASTGRAARELYHVREARGENHERDYLNVGSMGHNSSVALGIALAHPELPVVVLDGDAAIIMHMGSLSIIGQYAPKNLLHVSLNNGQHESVGGQPSAGWSTDLSAVASACGYATIQAGAVSSCEEICAAVNKLRAKEGPAFLDVHIRPGIRKGLPGLEVVPHAMRDSLMQTLGAV